MYNPSHSFDFLKSWFSLWAQSWKVMDTPHHHQEDRYKIRPSSLSGWYFTFLNKSHSFPPPAHFLHPWLRNREMDQTCFPFSHFHPPLEQSWSRGRSWGWCAWCIFCGWEEDHEADWDLEDRSLFHSFFSPSHQASGWGVPKIRLKSSISETFYQLSLWDFDA